MSARSPAVVARAPGKINLVLQVGPPGSDGYHEVASLFLAMSLVEEVTATESETVSVTVSGDAPGGAVPLDDRNLAVRAALLLARRTGYRGGVRLEISKRVPVAGGMGGGSADAAAALRSCNELWRTGLGDEELHELARELGADVSFALRGGAAIGLGRGDELTSLPDPATMHWVLLPADAGLSTPAVYAELDRLRAAGKTPARSRPRIPDAAVQALLAGDARALAPHLANDLQEPALALAPGLREPLRRGAGAGALAGIVSGSGPTLAFLCEDAPAAERIAEALSTPERAALPVTSARRVG